MLYVCVQTLQGLMGHSKIPGIQTDETIVEAVNRQLNSNTRQVTQTQPAHTISPRTP